MQCRRRGGHSGTGQLEVSLRGRLEPGVGFSRIEKRLGKRPAVSGAQPDRLSFLDHAHGCPSCTPVITKSVSVRPCSSAALE